MTKPVSSNRRGTRPCAGVISGASTSVALVAAREAALPVLPRVQVVVDRALLPLLVSRPVLARLLFLADVA